MARGNVTANRAVAVLAWALAATLAGVVAWWAVSIIGEQSGASREAVLTSEQVAAALADQRAGTPGSTAPPLPTPSGTPSPTASASPSASPTPSDPGDPEVVRTWTVTGGTLGASCRGGSISLLFATPAEGWSVEVKDSGPEHVEVELHRGETETTARAVCSGGTPVLSTTDED